MPEGDGFGVAARRPAAAHAGPGAAARADRSPSPRRSPRNGARSRTRSAPKRLPFTRAANVAIDRVAAAPGAGGRHARRLRRHRPALLPRGRARRRCAARQAAALGPAARLGGRGARRAAASRWPGVMPVAQPAASLAALRAAVAAHRRLRADGAPRPRDALGLAGARARGARGGALAADEAWALSRLDEVWQAELWGADDEARGRRRAARASISCARRDLHEMLAGSASAAPPWLNSAIGAARPRRIIRADRP